MQPCNVEISAWVRLRVHFALDLLRVWVDDRLLFEKTAKLPERAQLQLVMQPGEVKSCSVFARPTRQWFKL